MSETVYNAGEAVAERTIIESRHLNLYYGEKIGRASCRERV